MTKFTKSILSIIGILILLSTLSCTSARFTEAGLKEYLDQQEEIFEQISVAMGTEYWNLYTGDSKADLNGPKQQFALLFSNEDLISTMNTWYQKREAIKNAVLKRRVELWHNTLIGAKVNLDEEILELTNQLENWLSESGVSENRPSPDELETMALKLMKLRNVKAKELGFANYGEMILEITELGLEWFNSFVTIIDSSTLKPYQDLISKIKTEQNKTDIELSDIRKLAFQYNITRQGPEINKEKMSQLMKETVENIGIEFDTLPIQFEEREMPAGIGGQGFALHIPTDFRAVVMPGLSLGSRLHELGHGLQWMFSATESPILKGYEWCLGNASPAFAEGMAQTMAMFVQNPEWIKKYTHLTEKELLDQKMQTEPLAPALFRFFMTMFMFEIELYKDLDQNPDDLIKMLNKKYLLIEEPLKQPKKLADMILVSYPLYIHNYLIAEIISWQVHATLEEKFGKDYAFNKDVGEFLEENFWESGELFPWQIRLRRATGKELDVKGYLESLGL